MSPSCIVILSPQFNDLPSSTQRHKNGSFRHSSRNLPLKLNTTNQCHTVKCPTPWPVVQWSTSIAVHSLAKLSTSVSARNRRPVYRLPDTKSIDQCWFTCSGYSRGALRLLCRFLRFFSRKERQSSRYSRSVFHGWSDSLRDAKVHAEVVLQTFILAPPTGKRSCRWYRMSRINQQPSYRIVPVSIIQLSVLRWTGLISCLSPLWVLLDRNH